MQKCHTFYLLLQAADFGVTCAVYPGQKKARLVDLLHSARSSNYAHTPAKFHEFTLSRRCPFWAMSEFAKDATVFLRLPRLEYILFPSFPPFYRPHNIIKTPSHTILHHQHHKEFNAEILFVH